MYTFLEVKTNCKPIPKVYVKYINVDYNIYNNILFLLYDLFQLKIVCLKTKYFFLSCNEIVLLMKDLYKMFV